MEAIIKSKGITFEGVIKNKEIEKLVNLLKKKSNNDFTSKR